MRRCALLLASVACTFACQAQSFVATRLSEDGSMLTLVRADQTESAAPKLEDQDAFEKPAISSNGEYVGWLALYPNRGASYSQPIDLVVLDDMNRVHRFAGEFGMVFGWCFDLANHAVAFTYSFPHGATPNGFELRRIGDGKLLRRHLVPLISRGDEEASLKNKAPAWAQCTLASRSGR